MSINFNTHTNRNIIARGNKPNRKEVQVMLKEAKNELEANGYERKLVYKLSYQKNGIWKNAYFDDKDEAYTMIDAMQKINANAKVKTYESISLAF